MNFKYSIGDKVFTEYTWNDGIATIIPKRSIVKIIRTFKFDGINMYECEYNEHHPIYKEEWLAEIYNKPQIEELRECKIEIPKLIRYTIMTGEYRLLDSILPPELHNAKFHRWVDGGSEDFPETKISGLVEYEDGTMHIVPAMYIVFTDINGAIS